AALRDGSSADAAVLRHIIEVMHMDMNANDRITQYVTLLKTKTAHLQSISADERAALKQQWADLVRDVSSALDEDPAGPNAQALLQRWTSLIARVSGADRSAAPAGDVAATRATPELRDALWARRSEWLPDAAVRDAPASIDA